ncbi:unnamed protein product [Adineta ricciae]|uniref:Uncharacterized protein n=1 Tax=Adineta ricciae TaxID=249248 RepID=A0A815GW23_ADIRI|nr:unnamed protein product [Adineta ricciae]CAF1345800.1 unnamed protein product [Adineta ricciae]
MQSSRHVDTMIFNNYGWHLQWPCIWMASLGAILLCLSFNILGMEIGHTIIDARRSTAFGGFIIFVPLTINSICVLITVCLPKLFWRRITLISCFCMILLCIGLIAYDILVLIDPTRCFLISCPYDESLTAWPDFLRTSKRFLESVQLVCACLYILCCSLYILAYFTYRHFNLHRSITYESSDVSTTSIYAPYSYPYCKQLATDSNVEYEYALISQQAETRNSFPVQCVALDHQHQMCRRCMKQPQLILTNGYPEQNQFSYVCASCHNELMNYQHRLPTVYQIKVPMRTVC